jgi:glutamine synthetase
MGISVEYSHHEVAPSQHEIDLRYADALTMADNIMTFRLIVKEVALQRGVYATFMPKPLEGEWGNAMHLHLSLFNGDENAFNDDADPLRLSDTAKKFTAGLLRHAREITRSPTSGSTPTSGWSPASRRRCTSRGASRTGRRSSGADVQAAQGYVEPDRVPRPGPGLQPLPRVLRAARRRAQGHRGELRPARGDRGQHLRNDRHGANAAAGIHALPTDLGEALAIMERSELVAEALGEHLFDYFIANKRREWSAYSSHVTEFELKRYLATL